MLLRDVSLQDLSSYCWIWSLDPAAGYTMWGAYSILSRENLHQEVTIPDTFWQRHIPFVWRILRDRVPTKVNLFK